MLRRFADLPVLLPGALIVLAVGLGAAVSTQLADGWLEISDHWWSTFLVVGPLGLAGLLLVGRRLGR